MYKLKLFKQTCSRILGGQPYLHYLHLLLLHSKYSTQANLTDGTATPKQAALSTVTECQTVAIGKSLCYNIYIQRLVKKFSFPVLCLCYHLDNLRNNERKTVSMNHIIEHIEGLLLCLFYFAEE